MKTAHDPKDGWKPLTNDPSWSGLSRVSVVVFKDCKYWVAQCLEHDVCVMASNLFRLVAHLEAAIEAEDNFDSLPKAPDQFFEMWDKNECVKFFVERSKGSANALLQ
jgi:hypothetical protein